MKKLEEFKLHWIEEPTCADDVLGHKRISEVIAECIKFNLQEVVYTAALPHCTLCPHLERESRLLLG